MNKNKALGMVITSMVIWGTIGIFRRYIALPSSVIAFARGIIGSVFLIILCKVKGISLKQVPSKKMVGLLVLSGVLMGINWLLLFEAYNYTSVATATLCYYMEPVIVILVSPILFKEALTKRKIICVAVALFGMLLVSGVIGSEIYGLLGIVLGLAAALLYGTVVIMNKWLQGVDTYQKTIIQLLSAAMIMIPYMLFVEDMHIVTDMVSIGMLLFVGIVHTGIAYALYFGAIPKLKTQTVALFSYLDPVVAIVLSAVVLHESMSVLSIIGAICILGSLIVGEM